jgi:glutamine amidotransferase
VLRSPAFFAYSYFRMCRWIIFISDNSIILEDLLIKPNHSIVEQVYVRFRPGLYQDVSDEDAEELKDFANYLFNVHGFGLTWYTDTTSEFDPKVTGLQPAQFRTIAPISTDLAFHHLCAHTASTCTLAHIREASTPEPITVETNNHPFIFGDITFMHNGGIIAFYKIRFSILEKIYNLQKIVQAHPSLKSKSSVWEANYIFAIKGNTDTEHLGALFVVYLDIIRGAINAVIGSISVPGPVTILMALVLAINDIHLIQKSYELGPFNPNRTPQEGNFLNLCVADKGLEMVVTRWRDSDVGQPLSLYISLTAGAQLNRKYYPDGPPVPDTDEDVDNEDVDIQTAEEMIEEYLKNPPSSPQGMNVIVGSEPSTRAVKDWGLFGKNQCLTLDAEGNFEIQDLQELMQDQAVQALRQLFDYFLLILDVYEESPFPQTGFPMPDLPKAPGRGMPVSLPTKGSKLELGTMFNTSKGIKLNLH